MIRTLGLCLLSFMIVVTSWAQEEPEPKLERKKKIDKEEKAIKKEDPKDKDLKDDPDMPPSTPEEVEKAKERIIQNAKSASQRLGDKDPGEETRKIQKDVLKDLDRLLKQAMNPPPSDKNPMPMDNPMNGGGTGNKKQQPSPSSSSSGRKERKERADRTPMKGSQGEKKETQPPPKNGKEPKESASNPKGDNPKGDQPFGSNLLKNDPKGVGKFSEIYKDVWGHLPEKIRQEMDLYYREQFMPQYSELLREYYSALAEQKKK